MRIVVTGGAGYIGSRLSLSLVEAGHEVVIIDKLLFRGEGLLSHLDHPRVTFVRSDVRRPEAYRSAIRGADAMVHLVALVGETACDLDAAETTSINLDAVSLMLDEARSAGVRRFIFMSTCSNYGVSQSGTQVDEDAPLNPLSSYARTKVEAEKRVQAAASATMTTMVFRFGTICGLSPRMRFDLLVNDMARLAATGGKISLFTPEAWRPFLHVADAARVVQHVLAADAGAINGRVFNAVSENAQKSGLADIVRKHYPKVSIELAGGKKDLRDYRVSADRIRRELGFTPRYTIEDAFVQIARAVEAGVFVDHSAAIYQSVPKAADLHL